MRRSDGAGVTASVGAGAALLLVLAGAACTELFIPPGDDSCPNICTTEPITQTIIGCDDRVVLPAGVNAAEVEPWSFIGRFQGTAGCSGALIADRWVLTSAHCMETQGGGQLGFALAQVGPDVSQRPFGTHGVRRVYIPQAYSGTQTESARAYDFALAELWEPIGSGVPVSFGYVEWSVLRTRPAFTAGYPSPQPDGGVWERPWMAEGEYHAQQPFGLVDEGAGGLLYTTLDGSAGQSGAPVYSFLQPSQHPGTGVLRQVVGVLVGSPEAACMLDQMWVARLTSTSVTQIQTAMDSPSAAAGWWTVIDLPASPTVGQGEPWP